MKRFIVFIFVAFIALCNQLKCQSDSNYLIDKFHLTSVGIIRLYNDTPIGTGFIVIDSSIIMSAGHVEVLNPGLKFFQLLNTSRRYRLQKISIDTLKDLVLYKVLSGFIGKPISVDTSIFLNYNDSVFYTGYDKRLDSPNGEKLLSDFAIVKNSYKARQFSNNNYKTDCLEITADLIPGYSGGPVFTKNGNLIGLISQYDLKDKKKIFIFTIQPIIDWYQNTKIIK